MKSPLYERMARYWSRCEDKGEFPEYIVIHPDEKKDAWQVAGSAYDRPIKVLGEPRIYDRFEVLSGALGENPFSRHGIS